MSDNAIKAAAAAYINANVETFANDFSEAGEALMEAVLLHPDVQRILKRLGAHTDSVSACFISKNKRIGDGKGISIEIGIPICLNHTQGGETERGLEATVEVEVCSPDHPYYPEEIWLMHVSVRTADMETWPEFHHFETVLPEPELPEPVFIKKAT